jgi:hypothetical protein
MQEDNGKAEQPKRSYVLERMRRITSSSERAVKWLLYLWITTIGVTLLIVLWYFFW